MGVWTITYGTTEKSAAAWGLNAQPRLRLLTQAAGEFSFTMAGSDPAGAMPFPFEAQVTIRQNRTQAGGTWANDTSANHFTFTGRMISTIGSVRPEQSVELVFKDAWYDLEQLPFQQLWTIQGGTGYFSRAYLFYNPAYTPSGGLAPYLTVAQQITAIVNYAVEAGINIQPGTIQGGSQMPWYAVRGLSCAEAIRTCLECFPDLVVWIDGSQNPPALNCVYRANLTPLTLPYKGKEASGREHKSSQLRPRYDLVPSQVVIQYQQTVSVGGTSAVQLTTDAWPAGSTGQGLRAVVVPIDLRGAAATFSKTTIVTKAFDPTDVVGFWQTHVKSLKDADIAGTPALVDSSINTGTTYGISVVDSSGNPINYASLYPVEMIRPSKWASWTGVNVIEATVACYMNYTKSRKIGSSAARNTDVVLSHLHTTKIKLCNAPLGTTPYQTANSYNSGEIPISGLAQSFYNSTTQLQWEGHHEIIEPVVSQIIGPWNVLNLTGGAAAWATMAANIPEVNIDFYTNVTRITIGPARHLTPQSLNNYLQFFRRRIMFESAQTSTGSQIGAAADQSGDVPEEDSNAGHPQQGLKENRATDAVTGSITVGVTVDPANCQIAFPSFLSSTGAVQGTGFAMPVYYGSGAPGAGTLPANTNFRAYGANATGATRYIDTTANQEYYCTTAGNNSTSVWTQISGGGGSGGVTPQLMKIISDGGTYWVAQASSGLTQNVIKDPLISTSVTSRTIRGVTYSYSFTPVTVGGGTGYYTRTVAGSDGSSEVNVLIPDPIANDLILAVPFTGFAVSGIPMTISAVALASAGTGYSAGTYSISGGTGTAATVTITVGTGGAITGVSLATVGNYTALPTMTGATITGGGGTGGTFNLTQATLLYDLNTSGRYWAA